MKLQVKTIFLALFGVALGIGRNLPYQSFYPFGLSVVELLGILSIPYFLIHKRKVHNDIKKISYLMICMAMVFMISLGVNVVEYSPKISDIFEIYRFIFIAYLLALIVLLYKDNGPLLLKSFITGAFVTFFFAYKNPMNPDVVGFVQIFNPNVIGVILSVACFMILLLQLSSNELSKPILCAFFFSLTIFTFSKAAWLLSSLAFLLSVSFYISKLSRPLKLVMLLFSGIYAASATQFFFESSVYELILAKITATDFTASAASGGSFSARVGLILSALLMFINNPIFGVGLSGWEETHLSQAHILGHYFYLDDNPNSAFFYILSTGGLFAFVIWLLIFIIFLRRLNILCKKSMSKIQARSMISLAFVFLLIAGNVQNEMLSAYYYWVIIAYIYLPQKNLSESKK